MRLIDHDAFDQLVTETARRTGLPEAFVEKDYWVTEALRAIAATYPGAVVFKGGTSLSKGWRLLARFSEDLDLLVRRDAMTPPWSSGGQMERGLKDVCAVVGAVGGLTRVPERAGGSRPKRRSEFYAFQARFLLAGLDAGLVVEPGIGSGDWPTSLCAITSLIADTVATAGIAEQIGADDLIPFAIETLDPTRTFIEKLFILHAAVERCRSEQTSIGRRARHFADVAVLAEQPAIIDLIRGPTYRSIVEDVDRSSREWYGSEHNPPADLRFDRSSVFVPSDVADAVERDYDAQCRILFFGRAYPSFAECQSRLEGLRGDL